MELKLSSPVTELPGIGPAKAGFLAKLGITHMRDFLFFFPRRYDDFSTITPIKDLRVGERLTVKAKVKTAKNLPGFRGRKRLLRVFVQLEDETGVLQVTWFNLAFLSKQLWVGREVYVAGTVEASKKNPQQLVMRSPVLEYVDTNQLETTHTARITPVYPETFGITSRFLRYRIKQLLPLISIVPEYMPADIRERQHLMDIQEALKTIHFPETTQTLEEAQRRLRFDELFFLQLAGLVRRQHRQQEVAPAITSSVERVKAIIKKLPFGLTGAQDRAIDEVRQDMLKTAPMNRLLQGDVGSGKSAVALIAAAMTLETRYKVLYLAPTEILARQQAAHFAEFLGTGLVALLTGSLKQREKQVIKAQLQEEKAVCIIGTHALLQDDVRGSKIGLVIIDEQHRFGVAQRRALQQIQKDELPHLLSMTATPIPRTLTLTVYGDLDVSVLDELPPGRQPIRTQIVAPSQRDEAIIHMLAELHAGRQGYVITSLIDDSEKLEAKSAKKAFAEMKGYFPGIAVGLMHGQMPNEEKESMMRSFYAGAIQLLVATAVVEVGVNVPNATLMIIEGAERFGLAQLHQFRGRVGRGSEKSFCYLFPTSEEAAASARLKILASTIDGFAIAQADVELRGPGEVYGTAQSGFSNLKVASLLDYPTIKSARDEAQRLLQDDPLLATYPVLKAKVAQKNEQAHFE